MYLSAFLHLTVSNIRLYNCYNTNLDTETASLKDIMKYKEICSNSEFVYKINTQHENTIKLIKFQISKAIKN